MDRCVRWMRKRYSYQLWINRYCAGAGVQFTILIVNVPV